MSEKEIKDKKVTEKARVHTGPQLHIGSMPPSAEAIKEARIAVMAVITTRECDEATKVKALDVMRELFHQADGSGSHCTVTNCSFMG